LELHKKNYKKILSFFFSLQGGKKHVENGRSSGQAGRTVIRMSRVFGLAQLSVSTSISNFTIILFAISRASYTLERYTAILDILAPSKRIKTFKNGEFSSNYE
jgi:DNA integrity scanning protein DisA with diadenylate cyclase activity